MKSKLILSIAAIYLGLVGVGLLLAPREMILGLDPGAAPLVVSQIRAMSDVFIGVAVLNWAARNADASKAMDAILLGNAVGFGLSTILGTLVSLTGGYALSWGFTAASLFCAVGFVRAARAAKSSAA